MLPEIQSGFWVGFGFLTVVFLVASAVPCVASDCASAPHDGLITANPNRPTVSNPADITELGVLEVEYGYTRAWLRAGQRSNDVAGLFKFSALCDLELHWAPDSYIKTEAGAGSASGVGDNLVGAQFRFHRQSKNLPALAFRYDAKLPTASASNGLGSGEVDHSFTLLASKDIGKYHFDFNCGNLLAGRPLGRAFDRNFNFALAGSVPLKGALGLALEGSGETMLNRDVSASASVLVGLTYQIRPRFVIDTGVSAGVTSAAPHKQFLVGLTYSIAELYGRFRKH